VRAWIPAAAAVILNSMAEDYDDDWEDDDPDEMDDDASELVRCPSCGEEIFEDAERCPYCGDYVTHSTSALAGRPFWFCALGLLGTAAAIIYWLR
jgi:ribosomal protein S27E